MSTDPEDKNAERPEPARAATSVGAPGVSPGLDDDDTGDRPTVAPPFDPVAFAKEVLGGKPSPPPGSLTSTSPTTPPEPPDMPTRPVMAPATRRRPTPGGLLSLANARVPSNLPPRPLPKPTPPPKKESSNNVGAVDKEWEELATSPPPPLQQKLIDAFAREPQSSREPLPASSRSPLPAPRSPTPHQRSQAPGGQARSAMIPAPPTAQEMNDRVSLGDYTGALEIAERLLLAKPNDEAVKQTADTCRGVLRQMYTARIGPLDRVPMVMVARDQMRWLSIDHRAGFVLSLVDGVSSLEMILDVSGMPELDALRILSELAQQRIIAFR